MLRLSIGNSKGFPIKKQAEIILFMTKKIFAISTLILVLVVGAIFVYNFAFKKSSSQKTAESTGNGQKTSVEGKTSTPEKEKTDSSKETPIVSVTDESVFGATLSPDGEYIYLFLGSNGQLNQIDLDGKLEKVLSTEKFQNLKKIIWNKSKDRVIIETKDASGKFSKLLYYDLTNKSVITLKNNIDSVAWSSLGDKIIYKYYDSKTKKRTVSLSDPNGKNWRDLANFDYYNTEISPLPVSSDISYWPSPNAFTATSVNLVSFSGKDKKEILKDRFGVNILWSPNGQWGVVSYTDQKGGHKTDLALMSPRDGQSQSLGFPSFASKCVWSTDSKFIFCAMPGNIPESAVLPNDWQEEKIETSDTFWKIEAVSGKKTRLIDAEKISGSFDVLNPFLSKDEKTLFFVNKADGKLYKLTL